MDTEMPAPRIPYNGIRMNIDGMVINNPINEPYRLCFGRLTPEK